MVTQLRTRVSSLESSVTSSSSALTMSPSKSDDAQLMNLMKSYPADRQVKYLNVIAEIDVLRQQLELMKEQRLKDSISPRN